MTTALTAACFFSFLFLPRPEAQGDPQLKRAENCTMATERGVGVTHP